MKLSIVATLYQSAPYVGDFCRRACSAAFAVADGDFEIILVNDGSPDRSLELAIAASKMDGRITVVDLSRNFGHHKAMMAGLAVAKGNRVFLIDSDLEEQPEWLIDFTEQLEAEHCDVVYGVQKHRKGGIFERWSGRMFYLFFRCLTGLALPEDAVTARLMTRRYVNAFLLHGEREVMIAGLWLITGFEQHPRLVDKLNCSTTTYTLRKKVSILVNSVTSFSNAPLIAIFYFGILISVLAGAYTAYLIVHWLSIAKPPSGWTSVMASLWLLGGLVISFIGVIGIYLSKIFSETKQRPAAIVREIFNLNGSKQNNRDQLS